MAPKTRTLWVKFEPDEAAWLRRQAGVRHRSTVAWVIRKCVREAMEKDTKGGQQ